MAQLEHIKEAVGRVMETLDMRKINGKWYRLHKMSGPVEFGDACKLCDFNKDGNDCLKSGVCCKSPYGYFKLDEKFVF